MEKMDFATKNKEIPGGSKENKDPCLICASNEVDDILYGPFLQLQGIRCHYFCLLFCEKLYVTGCEVKDMAGFKVRDIIMVMDKFKKGKQSKVKCLYCDGDYPMVVCHEKSCKNRFHLPCGMKNHALMQFFGEFNSYCDVHAHKMIVRTEFPKETETCGICWDPLGPYTPVGCFQPPCCVEEVKEKEKRSYWMHYRCVMQGTRALGYYFNCFAYCCGKTDDVARQGYLDRGIFIPSRDALYEDGEHFKKLDKEDAKNDDYFETTYDEDATLFNRTFLGAENIECDYGVRCIGAKLGKNDILECFNRTDACKNFCHVKCIRYFRDIKSNEKARQEKFYCKTCFKGSCLALI